MDKDKAKLYLPHLSEDEIENTATQAPDIPLLDINWNAKPACDARTLGFADTEQMKAMMSKPQSLRDAEWEAFRNQINNSQEERDKEWEVFRNQMNSSQEERDKEWEKFRGQTLWSMRTSTIIAVFALLVAIGSFVLSCVSLHQGTDAEQAGIATVEAGQSASEME